MPRIRKKAFYEEICRFTIFAFVDQITGEIFVWKTKNPNLKSVFELHYFLHNARTRDMFRRGKEQGRPPEMYFLETVEDTEAVAFKHCIAWTKYFMEQNFESLSYEIHKRYTEHLDEITQQIYDEIRELFLSEVFDKKKRLFAEYGTLRKPRRKNGSGHSKITIELDEDDYNSIKESAQELNLSLPEYVKRMTLDGEIIHEDYAFFMEYKSTLDTIERRMRGILTSVCNTGKFLKADLNNLQILCEQVEVVHQDAMQIFKKRRRKKRKRTN